MTNNTLKSLCLSLLISFCGSVAAVDPAFSFHNKSQKTVLVGIDNGKIITTLSVSPNKFADLHINTKNETTLTIRNGDDPYIIIYKARFPTDKTIYVNWNDEHSPPLYHQRGPLLGLLGKTDRGYPTDNNVNDEDIIVLPAGESLQKILIDHYTKEGLSNPFAADFCDKMKALTYQRAILTYPLEKCPIYPHHEDLCRDIVESVSKCVKPWE